MLSYFNAPSYIYKLTPKIMTPLLIVFYQNRRHIYHVLLKFFLPKLITCFTYFDDKFFFLPESMMCYSDIDDDFFYPELMTYFTYFDDLFPKQECKVQAAGKGTLNAPSFLIFVKFNVSPTHRHLEQIL